MNSILLVLQRGMAGGLVLLVCLCCSVAASAQDTKSWQNEIAIYGWFAGIDGAVQFPSGAGSDFEIETSDIVDNLSMIFMGNYKGQYGRWSMLFDVVYMDVGDSTATSVSGITASASLDLSTWVLQGGVGYDVVQSDRATLAVIGGVRSLILEADVALAIQGNTRRTKSESENLVDGVVGVKGSLNLTDHWFIPYYADIGTGASELTYQLFTGVGYLFSWGDIRLGYRHLSYDLGDDKIMKDLAISGAILGVGFRF